MSSKIVLGVLFGILGLLITPTAAFATVTDFVDNPTSNRADWTAFVNNLGLEINSNVDFDDHPLGALDSDFYLGSDGVTFTTSGDFGPVTSGVGPGQGNISDPPLSPGEGPHPSSHYLLDGSGVSTLTITFDSPVSGVGLDTIDHFNPSQVNFYTIEAFTGPDGTGDSLGLFTSPNFNFQPNNLFFMGVVSTENNIRSFVLTDTSSSTGDTIGIDDIVFTAGEIIEPITEIHCDYNDETSVALNGFLNYTVFGTCDFHRGVEIETKNVTILVEKEIIPNESVGIGDIIIIDDDAGCDGDGGLIRVDKDTGQQSLISDNCISDENHFDEGEEVIVLPDGKS